MSTNTDLDLRNWNTKGSDIKSWRGLGSSRALSHSRFLRKIVKIASHPPQASHRRWRREWAVKWKLHPIGIQQIRRFNTLPTIQTKHSLRIKNQSWCIHEAEWRHFQPSVNDNLWHTVWARDLDNSWASDDAWVGRTSTVGSQDNIYIGVSMSTIETKSWVSYSFVHGTRLEQRRGTFHFQRIWQE